MIRYLAFESKCGAALSSFIDQKPSREYFKAVEPSEMLTITRRNFLNLVETNKHINMLYRDILEMAYTTSQKRIYSLQGDTAIEKLKLLLSVQPPILSGLPNKVAASYLGVTQHTLSRLKAKL